MPNPQTTDTNERAVTLAEMDAGVGSIPDVPEDEFAARYYSDEEFLAAIRLRCDNRTTDKAEPQGTDI